MVAREAPDEVPGGRRNAAPTGLRKKTVRSVDFGRFVAMRKGLEPSTSSVTGWHSNPLNYRTMWAFRDLNPGPIGYEPTALKIGRAHV